MVDYYAIQMDGLVGWFSWMASNYLNGWLQNEVSDTLPFFVFCVKHAVHESGNPA